MALNELLRANTVLHEYLEEKKRIGLISDLTAYFSITADQLQPAPGAYVDHDFTASETYYLEVLCPELARICCIEMLTPRVGGPVFPADSPKNNWFIRCACSFRTGEDKVPNMLEFLRTERYKWWTPSYLRQKEG